MLYIPLINLHVKYFKNGIHFSLQKSQLLVKQPNNVLIELRFQENSLVLPSVRTDAAKLSILMKSRQGSETSSSLQLTQRNTLDGKIVSREEEF